MASLGRITARLRTFTVLLVPVGAGQFALLVTGVLSARILGVEGRGIVATAMLIPLLAAFVATLGTSQLTTVLVARHGQARTAYAVVCRVTRVPIAVGTVLSVVVLFVMTRNVEISVIASTTVYSTVRIAQVGGVLNGLSRYLSSGLVLAAGPGIYALALIAAVFIGPVDELIVVLVWATASLIAFVVGYGYFVRTTQDVPGADGRATDFPSAAEIRRRGWSGLLGTYPPLESFRVDQLAVIVLAGPYQLGLYTTGLALANLPKLVGQALGVRVASCGSIRDVGRIMVPAIGLVAVSSAALSALCPVIVPFLFGPEFAAAVPIAMLLTVVGGVMGARKVITEVYRYIGAERIASWGEIATLVLFVAIAAFPAVHTTAFGMSVGLLVACAVAFVVLTPLAVRSWRRAVNSDPRVEQPAGETAR